MNIRPEALAALVAALVLGGVVLAVAGLRGSSAPPGPPSNLSARIRRWWTGAGMSRAQRSTRQLFLVGAIGVAVVVWLLFRIPVAAVLAGLAVPGVPWMFAIGAAEKRAIGRLEAVGEWIQRLNDRLSTGQGLQAAVIASVSSAPPLIEPEVRALADKLRTGLVRPDVALRQFADALDDLVVDQVVAALLLHLSDRGEQMSAVLASIADNTAKSVASRSEILGKRNNARSTVIFMAVFGLGTFAFVLVSEDLIAPYRTVVGQIVMAVILGIYIALLAWTRKLNAPRRRPRLLAPATAMRERA